MRKFLFRLLIVVALLVVAALVLPSLLDVNRYRPQIQSELEKRLGRKVTLGNMRLSILPLAFRARDMAISEDPRFGEGKVFAQAEEVQVEARLWSLLQGNVQVDSLAMTKPRVELVRNAGGEWNFASLGKATTAPGAAQTTPLSLASLKITDGQIAITDLREREERTVYDHIDLMLNDYAPGRAFDFRLAAHLPGTGAQEISLDGRTGPVADAWAATPFDGKLKLNQVSVASLQKFLHAAALTDSDAIASGETQLRNLNGKLETKGNLKLDQPRLRGVVLGFPVSTDYDISGDTRLGSYTINKGQLQLGATPVSISGTVVTATEAVPLNIDLKIAASDVSIEELARLGAAFGVAFNPRTKIAGRLTADLEAEGPANRPALRGEIKARDVAITGGDLPQPVRADAIALELTPAALRSNRFTASTGGTNVAVELLLADYSTDKARLDATIETGKAELGELLAIARAWGVSAAEGITGSGEASLSVRTTGPLSGAARRTYSGFGHLSNALLKLPSLAQPLRVAQAGLRFTKSSALVENLNASLGQTTATGNLRLRDFDSPRVEFALTADKMSLNEWQQLFVADARNAAASTTAWDFVPRAQAAAAASPSLLARTTGSGSLAVGTVIYDRITMTNVRTQVALDRGLIRLSPLTADVYGGKQSGTIVVDARSTPSTYSVSTKMDHVDANQLLSSVSSVKDKLFGWLAANGQTNFTASSAGDVARTLDGKVNLDLREGKINNMDLMYEIASAGKFLAVGRKMKPYTDLVQLAGDLDINDGVVRTDNLKAVISDGRMAATGTANLVDQSLNLRVTAVLSKEFSEEAGGTNVGGYLTTALANKNGELVVPLIVTGTFEKPRFAPDLGKIAQMKLENLAPTLSNPGELTSVLGAILGKKGKDGKQEPGADGDAAPQDPLGGILDALGGKKKKEEPKDSTGTSEPTAEKQPASSPLEDILGTLTGKKKTTPGPSQPASQPPKQEEQKPPEQPK
jgi:AsmA protein